MADELVCLGCGGAVGDSLAEGDVPCRCVVGGTEAPPLRCASCGGALNPGARGCPYCRATVSTRRCDGCFAWNLADAAHCQRCGSSLAGQLDDEVIKGGPCPRCGGALAARRYADLRVAECDGCGGLLLGPEMLARLITAKEQNTGLHLVVPRRAPARETTVRYLTCPGCGTSMNRQAFGRVSGVIVDVCKVHGVWFDAGELGEVITFVERGGLARARAKEAEQQAEIARSVRSEQVAARMSGYQGAGADPDGDSMGALVVELLLSLWR